MISEWWIETDVKKYSNAWCELQWRRRVTEKNPENVSVYDRSLVEIWIRDLPNKT